MRVLRTTLFADAYNPPVTTVVRDRDVRDSLESVRSQIQAKRSEHLTICEIFQMPDGSIEEATSRAMKIAHSKRITEKHMALLFYWLADLFPKGNEGASFGMPKRAPMSATDMRYVFDLLASHPQYRSFTIIGLAEDGTPVQLANGNLE